MENTERMIEICKIISQDVEQDVKNMEGTPFSGTNVAEMFGYQAAAIKALSDILQEVLKTL